jgi:zinc transport system permease protein
MGLALLLGLDASLGAFAFLAAGILLVWKLGKETALPAEILVGIIFVSSLALGFLIVPEPELLESLIGDISRLSPWSAAATMALSFLTILLVRRVYGGLMLLNISPDLAAVEGIRESRTNLWFLAAIAVVVSLGVKVTGSLLVGALVILPPATARLLSSNLRQYARASMALGVSTCLAGVMVSRAAAFPAGPAIILVNAVLFGGALAIKKVMD